MSLKLIKLDESYHEALLDMYDEWTKDQKENHTNYSPWAIFKIISNCGMPNCIIYNHINMYAL